MSSGRTFIIMHLSPLAALLGCAREPLPASCADLLPDELAITEIRGAQRGGGDADGQWVEVANVGGRDLDLRGAGLRLRRLDGSGDMAVVVRSTLPIPAGGYAVLGGAETLYSSAAVELEACGILIDRVQYHGLPPVGTLSFDGAAEPSAAANDDAGSWCADATPPGSPGERNRPCAAR